MKISKGTFIAIVVLIVWLILSWMLGTWLHLKSPICGFYAASR